MAPPGGRMDIRRLGLALASALLLLAGTGGTALAAPAAVAAQPSTECSATFFQDDRRLGPQVLPTRGEVGRELRGYRRTGDLTVQQFLDTYWDPAANGGAGGFRFPPANGYA